ncbi:hypothetical protein C0Z18_26360 [Trinickia dabaoshanensis]|uniref:Uncharacterized protein n=1 Tax=Trinickia dabaoshanensis TaxID=564714 RepID=A0A2N7VEL4_9BURK|nr:hypothetical protein C0Z18_26360 [Trinickia dabaoshanensis]
MTVILRRFDELWGGADHLSGEQRILLWESTGYRDWVIDLIDDCEANLPLDEDTQQIPSWALKQAIGGYTRHALLTLRMAIVRVLDVVGRRDAESSCRAEG